MKWGICWGLEAGDKSGDIVERGFGRRRWFLWCEKAIRGVEEGFILQLVSKKTTHRQG